MSIRYGQQGGGTTTQPERRTEPPRIRHPDDPAVRGVTTPAPAVGPPQPVPEGPRIRHPDDPAVQVARPKETPWPRIQHPDAPPPVTITAAAREEDGFPEPEIPDEVAVPLKQDIPKPALFEPTTPGEVVFEEQPPEVVPPSVAGEMPRVPDFPDVEPDDPVKAWGYDQVERDLIWWTYLKEHAARRWEQHRALMKDPDVDAPILGSSVSETVANIIEHPVMRKIMSGLAVLGVGGEAVKTLVGTVIHRPNREWMGVDTPTKERAWTAAILYGAATGHEVQREIYRRIMSENGGNVKDARMEEIANEVINEFAVKGTPTGHTRPFEVLTAPVTRLIPFWKEMFVEAALDPLVIIGPVIGGFRRLYRLGRALTYFTTPDTRPTSAIVNEMRQLGTRWGQFKHEANVLEKTKSLIAPRLPETERHRWLEESAQLIQDVTGRIRKAVEERVRLQLEGEGLRRGTEDFTRRFQARFSLEYADELSRAMSLWARLDTDDLDELRRIQQELERLGLGRALVSTPGRKAAILLKRIMTNDQGEIGDLVETLRLGSRTGGYTAADVVEAWSRKAERILEELIPDVPSPTLKLARGAQAILEKRRPIDNVFARLFMGMSLGYPIRNMADNTALALMHGYGPSVAGARARALDEALGSAVRSAQVGIGPAEVPEVGPGLTTLGLWLGTRGEKFAAQQITYQARLFAIKELSRRLLKDLRLPRDVSPEMRDWLQSRVMRIAQLGPAEVQALRNEVAQRLGVPPPQAGLRAELPEAPVLPWNTPRASLEAAIQEIPELAGEIEAVRRRAGDDFMAYVEGLEDIGHRYGEHLRRVLNDVERLGADVGPVQGTITYEAIHQAAAIIDDVTTLDELTATLSEIEKALRWSRYRAYSVALTSPKKQLALAQLDAFENAFREVLQEIRAHQAMLWGEVINKDITVREYIQRMTALYRSAHSFMDDCYSKAIAEVGGYYSTAKLEEAAGIGDTLVIHAIGEELSRRGLKSVEIVPSLRDFHDYARFIPALRYATPPLGPSVRAIPIKQANHYLRNTLKLRKNYKIEEMTPEQRLNALNLLRKERGAAPITDVSELLQEYRGLVDAAEVVMGWRPLPPLRAIPDRPDAYTIPEDVWRGRGILAAEGLDYQPWMDYTLQPPPVMRAIEAVDAPESMKGSEWLSWYKKQGNITQEDLEMSGAVGFLNAKSRKNVTKEELLKFLNEHYDNFGVSYDNATHRATTMTYPASVQDREHVTFLFTDPGMPHRPNDPQWRKLDPAAFHVRVSQLWDSDGRRLLCVEDVQNDWYRSMQKREAANIPRAILDDPLNAVGQLDGTVERLWMESQGIRVSRLGNDTTITLPGTQEPLFRIPHQDTDVWEPLIDGVLDTFSVPWPRGAQLQFRTPPTGNTVEALRRAVVTVDLPDGRPLDAILERGERPGIPLENLNEALYRWWSDQGRVRSSITTQGDLHVFRTGDNTHTMVLNARPIVVDIPEIEVLARLRALDVYDAFTRVPWADTWRDTALRYITRYAAENGFDGVIIPSGREQALRYLPSETRHASRVHVRVQTRGAQPTFSVTITPRPGHQPSVTSATVDQASLERMFYELREGTPLHAQLMRDGQIIYGPDDVLEQAGFIRGTTFFTHMYDDDLPARLGRIAESYDLGVEEGISAGTRGMPEGDMELFKGVYFDDPAKLEDIKKMDVQLGNLQVVRDVPTAEARLPWPQIENNQQTIWFSDRSTGKVTFRVSMKDAYSADGRRLLVARMDDISRGAGLSGDIWGQNYRKAGARCVIREATHEGYSGVVFTEPEDVRVLQELANEYNLQVAEAPVYPMRGAPENLEHSGHVMHTTPESRMQTQQPRPFMFQNIEGHAALRAVEEGNATGMYLVNLDKSPPFARVSRIATLDEAMARVLSTHERIAVVFTTNDGIVIVGQPNAYGSTMAALNTNPFIRSLGDAPTVWYSYPTLRERSRFVMSTGTFNELVGRDLPVLVDAPPPARTMSLNEISMAREAPLEDLWFYRLTGDTRVPVPVLKSEDKVHLLAHNAGANVIGIGRHGSVWPELLDKLSEIHALGLWLDKRIIIEDPKGAADFARLLLKSGFPEDVEVVIARNGNRMSLKDLATKPGAATRRRITRPPAPPPAPAGPIRRVVVYDRDAAVSMEGATAVGAIADAVQAGRIRRLPARMYIYEELDDGTAVVHSPWSDREDALNTMLNLGFNRDMTVTWIGSSNGNVFRMDGTIDNLLRQIRGAAAPPPPAGAPPPRPVVSLPTVRLPFDMSSFWDDARTIGLTDEGIEDAKVVIDAIARAWSRINNRQPEDWYTTYIAEVHKAAFPRKKMTVEFHPRDVSAIISLFDDADISTFFHEIGHILGRQLSPGDSVLVERHFGVKKGAWTDKAKDDLAKAFWKEYLEKGQAPSDELKNAFSNMKDILLEVYRGLIRRRPVTIDPKLRELLDFQLTGVRKTVPISPVDLAPHAQKAANKAMLTEELRKTSMSWYRDADGTVHFVYIPGVKGPISKEAYTRYVRSRRTHLLRSSNPQAVSAGVASRMARIADPVDIPTAEHATVDVAARVSQLVRAVIDDAYSKVLEHPAWRRWGVGRPRRPRQPSITAEAPPSDWDAFFADLEGRLTDIYTTASWYANQARYGALLDYADRRVFDPFVKLVFPWGYWHTRQIPNWVFSLMRNPGVLSSYGRFRNRMEANNRADPTIPERARHYIPLHLPWTQDRVLWELEATFLPVTMIFNTFNDEDREKNTFGQVVSALGRYGPATHPLLMAAYAAERWLIHGDTEAARSYGYLSPASRVFADVTGVALEPWLWLREPKTGEVKPFVGGTRWELGLAGRYAARHAPHDLAAEAVAGRAGPVFEAALRRVTEMQRVPSILSILLGLRLRPMPDWTRDITIMSNMYVNLKNEGLEPKEAAEKVLAVAPWMGVVWMSYDSDIERLSALAYDVLDRVPPGMPRGPILRAVGLPETLLDKFYESKGDLTGWRRDDIQQFRQAIFNLAGVLRSPDPKTMEEWEKARKKRSELADKLAKKWPNAQAHQAEYFRIMSEKGRDAAYAFAREKGLFDFWFALNSAILDDPLLLKYYADPEDVDRMANSLRYRMAEETWPGILKKQQEYYSLPAGRARREYLKAHPELRAYWTWNRSAKVEIPNSLANLRRQAGAGARKTPPLRKPAQPSAAQQALIEALGGK